MSVVGIDFGNLNTVIAVARNKGIDVITNDVSNRLTPSMISFSPKARQLGESAKTLEISNFKNTIASIKRLIGVPFDAMEYVTIEKNYLNCELVKDEKSHYGGIAVRIVPPENDAFLDGNNSSFAKDEDGKIALSMVQLVAMYLGKVKDITEHALGRAVCDTVISVPMYFTDGQRRALLDAAQIANLNVLRLIHDTTACGLAYGIPKSDLPDAGSSPEGGSTIRPRYVCIIDFGQSASQVSIMAFTKGKLEVRGAAYDMHLGGRNFDEAMVNSLVKDLNQKYKVHLQDYPKSMYRLRLACERTKKILSANNKAVLGIENLLNDMDVSMEVSRTDLDSEPWQELLHSDRLLVPLRAALAQAKLQPSDMDVVELVGGSSRIPSVRDLISKFFNGMELSQTLNQDEAVARGAAFQCAILSPTFKVKDFTVVDSLSLPIHLYWEPIPSEPEDKDIVLFDRGNTIPSTKLLTFFRDNDFTITAGHDNLKDPIFASIGTYTIMMKNSKNITPSGLDHPEALRVKVKVRLNGNGIVGIEQATLYEEQEQDVPSENIPSEEPVSQDATASPPTGMKKKILVKKGDITVQMFNRSLPPSMIATYQEYELSMKTADRLVSDTEFARNSLEEYIYEMRGKINSDLASYASPQDKISLTQNLQAAEDWLYSAADDGGSNATKSVYLNKLSSLKSLGDPIVARKIEDEAFQVACTAWANTAEKLRNQLTSQDAKYDHIPFSEREPVLARLETAWKSSLERCQEHSRLDKTIPVPKAFLASSLKKDLEDIVVAVSSLMNRPKPKVTPPVTSTPPMPDQASTSSASNVFTDDSGNVTVEQMDLD